MAAVSRERQQGLLPTSAEGRSEPRRIWSQPLGEVVAALETNLAEGLTAGEAERRLRENGRNELANDRGPNAAALLAAQFKSVVIWVLIGAAVVSFGLGEVADALAIAAIVLLNALIGFYQEYRAERAVAALRKMAAPLARVVRGGHALAIPAAEVVRGDLLLLEAGDLVAADARVVEASTLRANEAPLTGESPPVGKHAGEVAPGVPLAERRNVVYLGTSVVGGQGRAVVVATGMQTEVGKIASLLHQAGVDETPLQQRLDRVGRTLLVGSLAIVVVVFLLGLLRGEAPGRLFLTAVSLAVAAVPEGLPAVVTVAQLGWFAGTR